MTISQADVVRPLQDRRPVELAVAAVFGALLILGLALPNPDGERPWDLVAAGTAGLATFGLIRLARRRSQFVLLGDRLDFRGLRSSKLVIDGVGTGTIVTVDLKPKGQTLELWIGQSTVSIVTEAWDADDLERLATRLRLARTAEPEAMTAKEIERKYPGTVPRWLLRPNLIAAVVVVLVVVVSAVVGIVR